MRKQKRETVPPKRNQGPLAEHAGIETVPLQPMLCAILRDIQGDIARTQTGDSKREASSNRG